MNYTDELCMCRVDFFKPSGKWYTTEAIAIFDYSGDNIHEVVKNAIKDHLKGRLKGMTAVCLIPHHKNSHPHHGEVCVKMSIYIYIYWSICMVGWCVYKVTGPLTSDIVKGPYDREGEARIKMDKLNKERENGIN